MRHVPEQQICSVHHMHVGHAVEPAAMLDVLQVGAWPAEELSLCAQLWHGVK